VGSSLSPVSPPQRRGPVAGDPGQNRDMGHPAHVDGLAFPPLRCKDGHPFSWETECVAECVAEKDNRRSFRLGRTATAAQEDKAFRRRRLLR
jgi:hypothetical protein